MRIFWFVIVAAALACASCGNRTVQVVTAMPEAKAKLAEDFAGRLLLSDGARLKISNGRLLGDWVCGTPTGRRRTGEICIESRRVRAVEEDVHYTGAGARVGQGIALIPMLPVVAIWSASELENQREAKASAERRTKARRIAEARAAARGEVLPPLPTAEDYLRTSAFYSLANCFELSQAGRKETDGDTLAERVWRERETCLDQAVRWFALAGEADKARGLAFVQNVRNRYRELACGLDDPGLRAPTTDVIGRAGQTWMDEYRAIAAAPQSYDFPVGPGPCRVPGLGPPEHDRVPDHAARDTALAKATSDFPLTRLPDDAPVR